MPKKLLKQICVRVISQKFPKCTNYDENYILWNAEHPQNPMEVPLYFKPPGAEGIDPIKQQNTRKEVLPVIDLLEAMLYPEHNNILFHFLKKETMFLRRTRRTLIVDNYGEIQFNTINDNESDRIHRLQLYFSTDKLFICCVLHGDYFEFFSNDPNPDPTIELKNF